jgi:hypothetical protein
MIISRMKAGWLMIGGSIFLFVLTDMLPNSPIFLAVLKPFPFWLPLA